MDTQSLMNAAYDSRALNDLKREASTDPKGKALQVAKQVEGMFVQMMLKSMREALPQDGIFSNESTQNVHLDVRSADCAGDRQARARHGRSDPQADAAGAGARRARGTVPMPLDESLIYSAAASSQLEQMVRKALPRLPVLPANMPTDSSEFIVQLTLAACAGSGISHHLILAQAALESGWGQRQILTRDGKPSYNVFGIKASGNWKSETTEIMTSEYEQGEAKKVHASFRVYHSYFEALNDYVQLLTNNPCYAAVTSAQRAELGAHTLQAAGYATDSKYAQKLVGMIQQFKSMNEKVFKAYSKNLNDLF
ncbi:flagellar assembly peptidoglycan hydrolase FlgJ [Candidatus Pantoea persica]|uniref:flagellar assembly peptidoglycan hydrolase FlgJ n=1 Tax=Candidatus Pantoea persica TaxID=2518128 RepID=UPI00403D7DC0|nr:Peptidoglycan hydrolase FlgJ [Candidatus Pantoea persica]